MTAGSAMGHVTYIIMSGIAMEYLGPNMTPTRHHVTQKNEIFCQKMASKLKIRPSHIDIMRHKSRDLDKYLKGVLKLRFKKEKNILTHLFNW